MSTGANFILVINDGKLDNVLTANKLLRENIAASKRRNNDQAIITDIERTHILFVHAHYRPFVAIAFEYQKIGGTASFNQSTDYQVPMFGDFFSDAVLHATIPEIGYNKARAIIKSAALTTPAKTGVIASSVYPDNLGTNFYSLVDSFGTAIGAGVNYVSLFRYCEFPGNALLKKVKFSINTNVLDEYTSDCSVMHEKFCVPMNKRDAYNRLTGQEVPVKGWSGVKQSRIGRNYFPTPSTTGASMSSLGESSKISNISSCLDEAFGLVRMGANPLTTNTTAAEHYTTCRREVSILNGPQTPKFFQPALDLWVRLNFWFCRDFHLSLPSVAIPFGQRRFEIHYADFSDLVKEVPHIYLQTTVLTGVESTGTTPTTIPIVRSVSYNPIRPSEGGTAVRLPSAHTDVPPSITTQLYVNHLFVNPEVHAIYVNKVTFTMVRVWRENLIHCEGTTNQQQLTQLKWPIEYMFVGVRPKYNITPTLNPDHIYHDWHRFSLNWPMDEQLNTHLSSGRIAATENARDITTEYQVVPDLYYQSFNFVTSIDIIAHGIKLFDAMPSTFFSQYVPYHYGGLGINPPIDDPGAMFINFALHPTAYQPSGHINVSRAREFYLNWASHFGGACDLVVVASAINFLMLSDGSGILRFST
jgi:hypothetical protein